MVSGALISERDGIVGSWQGQTLKPKQRNVDHAGNLKDWEPWVRAAIVDFDLLSNLHFSTHPEMVGTTNVPDAVTVWSLNVTTSAGNAEPAAAPSRIATFIRPTEQVFQDQLKYLDQYSDLRDDRAAEILSQLGPQYAFWSSVVYLHPDRTRKTIELIDAALRLANFVEMRVKHALACRRPNELSPQVQPMILTPGHGTFPSGHSTENHMVARILWELLRGVYGPAQSTSSDVGEQLMRSAARIAVNRTVAGVHFPVDTAAGQVLGLALARYFIVRATGVVPAQYDAWRFDGTRYPGNTDFDFHDFYDPATGAENANLPYINQLTTTAPAMSAILNWLWKQAVDEWSTAP